MKKTSVQDTLKRLQEMSAKNSKREKIAYWKAKQGKNNLLVLATKETGDPFLCFGEHKNLLTPSYISIPCVKHNNGEECIICHVVDEMKKKDFMGTKDIWKPIEMKERYYSPVIDLDDISKGIQWWGYGISVLSQLSNWLTNIEDDDEPTFYDLNEPTKVVVTFDKEKDPALMYSLDKKRLKSVPEGLDIEALVDKYTPLSTILDQYKKTDDELSKIIDEYLKVATSDIEDDEDEDEEEKKDEKVSTKNPFKGTSEKTKEDDDEEDEEEEKPKFKKLVKKG